VAFLFFNGRNKNMSLPIAFVAVVLIWSTTPLAIKWSALGAGFGFAVFARMAIGVVLCALLLAMLRIRMPWHRSARLTYVVGGSSVFGAMTLTYWAAQFIGSGLIAVLFGLSPLMTAVGAAYWLQEKSFSWNKVGGMLLGLIGLAVIFQHNLAIGPHAFAGIAAVLCAVALQSFGLVWMKRIGDQSSPVAINLGSLVFALPLFALTWLLSDGQVPAVLPQRAVIAIAYLGLFGSVIGFVLYFYMIKHMEAGRVALITLITPVLALLLGHGFNNEAVPLNVWIGTTGILAGLSLHQWGNLAWEWLRRKRGGQPQV
jgi:drug/metabolite transporter (DMT)-like permease